MLALSWALLWAAIHRPDSSDSGNAFVLRGKLYFIQVARSSPAAHLAAVAWLTPGHVCQGARHCGPSCGAGTHLRYPVLLFSQVPPHLNFYPRSTDAAGSGSAFVLRAMPQGLFI